MIGDAFFVKVKVIIVFSNGEIWWVIFVTPFLVEGWNFDYSERFLKRSRKLILMLRTVVGSCIHNSKQVSRRDKLKTYQQVERYRSQGSSISSERLGIHKVSSQVRLLECGRRFDR